MYTQTLAAFIASTVDALHTCEKNGSEWAPRHKSRLTRIERDFLPSGSGIDCGTILDRDESTRDKLVFRTEFHHMNSEGMYDGWTQHTVTVTPAFDAFNIRISGRDRNGIKEYLYQVFHECLGQTDTFDESRGDRRAPWYHKTEPQG